MSAGALEAATGLDRATVADFLDGVRYPKAPTRGKVEAALDLPAGSIERAARGAYELEDEGVDPVERAIQQSALTRANKAKLTGTYYELLDSQQERGAAG